MSLLQKGTRERGRRGGTIGPLNMNSGYAKTEGQQVFSANAKNQAGKKNKKFQNNAKNRITEEEGKKRYLPHIWIN